MISTLFQIAILSSALTTRQPSKFEMVPSRKVGGSIVIKSPSKVTEKFKRPRSAQLSWIDPSKKSYIVFDKNKSASKK